ncbi:MAG: nitroreductase family protein [Caldisericaceae bacterium]
MENKNVPSLHGQANKSSKDYPNETLRILCERGSLRNFSDKKIPKEVLQLILEAGIHAPTGGNLQPYSIIKIQNQSTKEYLAKICEQNFIEKAPIDLLFCIDWHLIKRWAELECAPFAAISSFRHFWISFQDALIAAQSVVTAADSMGLGSVYVGTVVDFVREIRKLFELPQGVFPVVLLSLGYPSTRPMSRKKLGTGMIVHDEKYEERSNEDIIKNFGEKYSEIKIPATSERIETIRKVCNELEGEALAATVISRIQEAGYINAAQRYFGLHYIASEMVKGNDEYLNIMKEAGFDWFEKFESKNR